MDPYADALVKAKNAVHRFTTRYQLIDRLGRPDELAAVGFRDRLYVLIHGRDTLGVGARQVSGHPYQDVTGDELADRLIARGLRNKVIDLRLWTCSGGRDAATPAAGFGGVALSFAGRVHARLHAVGHRCIAVCSYLEPVSLAGTALAGNGGHKKLAAGGDHTRLVGTAGLKTHYPRASII